MEKSKRVVVDGLTLPDLETLHAWFAPLFPPCYGRTLDALYDALTDPQTHATVVLRNSQALAERFGPRGRALAVLLRRAARENPRFTLLESPDAPEETES